MNKVPTWRSEIVKNYPHPDRDAKLVQDYMQAEIDELRAALAAQPEQAGPTSPVYGIIDPDYARVFTQARIVAWQYGYACVMHGSFTRDLDLLLVPWTEQASGNDDQLLKLIAQGCGLRFGDGKEDPVYSTVDWTVKPHGRKACSLYFPAFGDRRWIDISIYEKPPAQPKPPLTAWTDSCTEENCQRCRTHPNHRGNMQHAGIGSYPPAQPEQTGQAADRNTRLWRGLHSGKVPPPAQPEQAGINIPELVDACEKLVEFLDKNPPMGESIWAIQRIRAALRARSASDADMEVYRAIAAHSPAQPPSEPLVFARAIERAHGIGTPPSEGL